MEGTYMWYVGLFLALAFLLVVIWVLGKILIFLAHLFFWPCVFLAVVFFIIRITEPRDPF